MKTDKKFPDTLPFLPGNVYADPTITRYHKTQLLGIRDGIITGKFVSVTFFGRENMELARASQPGTAQLHEEPGRRDSAEHSATQAIQ